jgi:hypothetical protein
MITPGLYYIRNLINDRLYIGSSVDVSARWREHKVDLKSGKHSNHRLVKDHVEFGPEAFEYGIITELAPGTDLYEMLLVEQWMIHDFRPYYNLVHNVFARIPADKHGKWVIIDPKGNESVVLNLNQYCREHGCFQGNMIKVADGKLSHTHGYKCRRFEDKTFRYVKQVNTGSIKAGIKLAKPYEMTHPDGRVEQIVGLNAFCKAHGLNRDSMRHAIRKKGTHQAFRGVRL